MDQTNHTIDLSDRMYKITFMAIGLAAIFAIGKISYDFKTLPHNFPIEISITGEGKAIAKPDVATTTFGVTSQSEKSQDAVNQNNQKMSAVIQAVKNAGVEDKDIRTTMYNLYPVYGSGRVEPLPLYYPYPSTSKIIAYRLEQQVEVKIRNFDKINEIIDKATSSGANTVGNLQFTVDDIEKVREEARANAIKQAQEKAAALASQTGLKIEKLINVYEGYGPGPIYGFGGGVMAKESAISPAPQIEPGQNEINISVTLTYRIK